MTANSKIIEGPHGEKTEVFPLDTSEEFLLDLLKDVFENHWNEIRFGSCINGLAWSVTPAAAPRRISLSESGFLTVSFDNGGFHLRIGLGDTSRMSPAHVENRKATKTERAEFFRRLRNGGATAWGLRFYARDDSPQMVIRFPNPFGSEHESLQGEPDFDKLGLWDEMRKKHLGLGPDEVDRSAKLAER